MLRFISLLLLSPCLWASELMVLNSEFHNQNWYPLPKEDMHTAAVDSLISQIALSHNFKLLSAADPRAKQAGEIQVMIDLIEKAEVIKVSAQWSSFNGVTHVSNQSLSLHGQYYDEIYNTIELAGRKAGIQISQQIKGNKNTKSIGNEEKIHQILMNQGDIAASLLELRKEQDAYMALLKLKVSRETPPDQKQNVSKEFDMASKRQLDLAARLKREEKFAQAYATLRSLDARPSLDEELRKAVREELYFSLPIYQADTEFADIGSHSQAYQHDGTLWPRIKVVETNLQSALKNNEQDIRKSGEINRRLDQLAITTKYMRQALHSNTISQHYGLRIRIIEFYMLQGRYPEPSELKREMKYFGLDSKVEKTSESVHEAIYTFTTRDGQIIKMHANNGHVEIQM